MNKAFEKILERLEETDFNDIQMVVREVLLKYGFPYESVVQDEVWDALDELSTNKFAIKIVQEVAEEYNGGWIPCSEKLPEIGQEVIVATKKGSVFSNIYYDYTDSNAKEPCFHSWDDEMWNCFEPDVIAWQPLPEPYKEREQMKVYISGAITGTDDYMERFESVEKELTEQGYSVVNPAKVNAQLPEDTDYEDYMKMSFCMLSMCDSIYMLRGFEKSCGAKRELEFAKSEDMEIMYEEV